MELSNCPIRINDGLFIGDQDTACDFEFFSANVIAYVVNCSEGEVANFFEGSEIRGKPIQYLPWYADTIDNDSPCPIESCCKLEAFLRNAEADGASCLMHSKKGTYRAVCAACILIMLRYHWSAKKTLEFIVARLPDVMLKKSFIRQLILLEKKLQAERGIIFSHGWNDSNVSDEECLVTNTFKNSFLSKPTDQGRDLSYVRTSSSSNVCRRVQWKDEEELSKVEASTFRLDGILLSRTDEFIGDDCSTSTDCDSPGFRDEFKHLLNPRLRRRKDQLPIFHRIKSPF